MVNGMDEAPALVLSRSFSW